MQAARLAVLVALCGCARLSPEWPRFPSSREPPGLPALPEDLYSGRLIESFEMLWFTPCGTNDAWWFSGGYEDIQRFTLANPDLAYPLGWKNTRLLVRVAGQPSATGRWGHLGQYSRELSVRKVLEVREYREGDCGEPPAPPS